MNKIDVVALFVHVADGLQFYEEVQDLFARERYRSDFKFTVAEAVTLFLLFQGSGFRHSLKWRILAFCRSSGTCQRYSTRSPK